MSFRFANAARALVALAAWFAVVPAVPARAGEAAVAGVVVDVETALPLAGARVEALGRGRSALSGADGRFRLALEPGLYRLRVTRDAYVTTDAEDVVVLTGGEARVTLAVRRAPAARALHVIGTTATRADRALQTSTTIARTLDAETLARNGDVRAADALRRLPGVNNGIAGDTAALADDVQLSLRGIGTLETMTTIDGHPVGLGFPDGFNAQLSPLVGLRDLTVTYGSGSGVNGIDAIGGVIDERTIEPTRDDRFTLGQSAGTWNRTGTRLQATGTRGRLGFALAAGVSTLDGPLRGTFYQSGAAFDPSATDPALRAEATYPTDSRATARAAVAKLRYDLSAATRLTFTALTQSLWEDKTGNGDGDYLDVSIALAQGQAALAGKPSGDPCPAGAFTVTNAYAADRLWGQNRAGAPDGGAACQTPSSYATAVAGWQGAGPAYQADHVQDEALRLDTTAGVHALRLEAFTNRYAVHFDRYGQLPYAAVPFDAGSVRDNAEVTTGVTFSDDVAGRSNTAGIALRYLDRAFDLRTNGRPAGAPNVHDTALGLRDVVHAPGSKLTLAANAWATASSATSSGAFDPRLSAVYRVTPHDVLRLSAGATTTQPSADQLGIRFSGTRGFGAGGGPRLTCAGINSIGNAPSTVLKPERGVDTELAFGHGWGGDASTQLQLYDVNVFDKLYRTLVPLAAVGAGFVDAATLAADRAAVASACGTNGPQTDALLGVSGTVNVGRLRARGATIDGRARLSRRVFVDYDWALDSTVILSAPEALLRNDVTQIPGSQLPRLPLHTFTGALDATIGAIEARYTLDAVSANNTKALPPYTVSALRVVAPVARGVLTISIENLFNQNAGIRGLIGEGVPLALSGYAKPEAYGPLGNAATERFGLPYRAFTLDYAVRLR